MNHPLGLVCVSASNVVRYKTITRKRFLQFETPEQEQILRDLYAENLRRLIIALDFCAAHQICLYRMGSGLFPFADEVIGSEILTEFADAMSQIGEQAKRLGIRMVMHPEQFVVLNSDRPEVIKNSIKVLSSYARTFDLLGQPRSPWALMNIHGGKGDRAQRLVQVVRNLPDNIRLRLTFENDEYTYGVADILEICHGAGVPMVFDAHHHVIYEHSKSYDDPSVAVAFEAARETWEIPHWQVVHISNGVESFADQKHSDYITVMPKCYRSAPCWIEVEAKQKELAIEKLQHEWWNSDANVLTPMIKAVEMTGATAQPTVEQTAIATPSLLNQNSADHASDYAQETAFTQQITPIQ
ncbi:UV DNA damage repair endonuclease UvsE [Myxacorys almedinensis]|uniref:UV DNA damage repair endonuclease UvsE n=1 Tax=Myxacorys almedinensis A TaxID=2690445 RepID=A0A8J7Z4S8_9CYAN|nr:UV DNA damage repair endonuclease UvsE [Myxacorys almedinensis]NDJ17846.1 UV DNA damage repair endonuclease UvsE [Myxacorys almedinensis A]